MQNRAEQAFGGRRHLTYFREFAQHWPNLLGAGLGLALGPAINHYMMNLFGPPLIAEFGWTKAQFALVGVLGIAGMLVLPIAGRITDRFGARVATIIGFSAVPAGYFALSLQSGSIHEFYGILLFTYVLGVFATTFVFTRVVVERFDRARGLALSCLLSFPPLTGALAVQFIGDIIEDQGWRAGYRALAMVSALGGVAAVILIGRSPPQPVEQSTTGASSAAKGSRLNWADFRSIARKPVFLFLLAGMFFCNLPQVLVSSQMNIMLMENGASARFATTLVSAYAISVVVGRFMSGIALDRIPAHIVAIVALGLPAIGYVALASTFDAYWILTMAIVLVGLAQGAETDVSAILTSRKFSMAHYSFIFSLLMASMGIASALGSGVLSGTLAATGTFDLFLAFCALATVIGAICFFLTGRYGREASTVAVAAPPTNSPIAGEQA